MRYCSLFSETVITVVTFNLITYMELDISERLCTLTSTNDVRKTCSTCKELNIEAVISLIQASITNFVWHSRKCYSNDITKIFGCKIVKLEKTFLFN